MINVKVMPDGSVGIESNLPIATSYTHLVRALQMIQDEEDPELAKIGQDPYRMMALNQHVEKLRNRLNHALKRLKDKHYHADTLSNLISLPVKAKDAHAVVAMQMHVFDLYTESKGTYETEITDEFWLRAIDLTMAITEPSIYEDPEAMFTPALYQHLDLLYIVLIGTVHGNAILETLRGIHEYRELFSENTEKVNSFVNEMQETKARADAQEKKVTEHKDVIRELQEGMITDRRAWEKARLGYEHEIQDLKRQLAATQDANAGQPAPEQGKPATETVIPEERVWHDLPEENLVFVGGDQNMTKKLAIMYPGWTFIDSQSRNFSGKTKAKAIFVWSGHMSHATTQRINRVYEDSVPRLYVTKTNIAALVREMTEVWSDYIAANSTEASE